MARAGDRRPGVLDGRRMDGEHEFGDAIDRLELRVSLLRIVRLSTSTSSFGSVCAGTQIKLRQLQWAPRHCWIGMTLSHFT